MSKDSRFWRGQFWMRQGDGTLKKVCRSTGTADRREAGRILELWMDAARGQVTGEQARRVLADLLGEGGRRVSVRAFAEQWLAQRKLEVKPATFKFYSHAVTAWTQGLGTAAERALDALGVAEVTAWRADRARFCGTTTVNHYMKCVRMILKAAVDEGWLRKNPAAGLRPLKKSEEEVGASARRPFSREEIARVLAVADPEWRGMVLLGLYTGQRLGDLATRETGHLREGAVYFQRTQKTGAEVWVPLPAEAQEALAAIPRKPVAKGEKDWLFPGLRAAMVIKGKVQTNELSRQFAELLAVAGLREKEVRATPKQLAARRAQEVAERGVVTRKRQGNELVFHSLRHNTRTWLEESGAPVAVIDALMGQDARTGRRSYTHIGKEAIRTAAEGIFPKG